MQKIYIKGEKPKDISELIRRIATGGNWMITYFVGGATYNDEACLDLQCANNKRRSFDDIYHACNTYFPGTSAKDVFKAILSLNIKKGDLQLYPYFTYCSGIRRIVILYYKDAGVHAPEVKYDSLYSWKELFEMLDITPNDNSIIKFHKENKTEPYIYNM